MRIVPGKTAFVTGGASGIGLALGQALAAARMNVMLADVEAGALKSALDALADFGGQVRGVVCDVADLDSVEHAAAVTCTTFRSVHLVCNNAGVTAGYGIGDISPEAWRWVFDVNVMGTLHGVRTFLPHMQAHGEGGHFVNTASIAGLQSEMGFGAYGASKHAVVGMSEGLAMQAKPLGIGVTILCPSFVRTRISDSRRNWPARYGAAPQPKPESEAGQVARLMRSLVESGEDPSLVARRTIEAIERDDLYVFTGPGLFPTIEKRMAAITAAMQNASDLKQSS